MLQQVSVQDFPPLLQQPQQLSAVKDTHSILVHGRHDMMHRCRAISACLSVEYYFASAAVAVDSSHMTASSSVPWSRFDVVSLRYVPDDGTLGCRETLHVELKDAQGRADG